MFSILRPVLIKAQIDVSLQVYIHKSVTLHNYCEILTRRQTPSVPKGTESWQFVTFSTCIAEIVGVRKRLGGI